MPSPSGTHGGATLAIVFGTELSAERVVPVGARTTSFERGDLFAYAVDGGQPAEAVYVEVERTDGGPLETVQEPIEAQPIPDAPALIGFTVESAILLDAWGPGAYLMRIYLEPRRRADRRGAVRPRGGPAEPRPKDHGQRKGIGDVPHLRSR